MNQKASARRKMLATNGDFRVSVVDTSHSLSTPLAMATTLLRVLMSPKVRERSTPFSSNRRLWESATIQLSKTLNRRLVPRPPKARPATRKGRLGIMVRRHERE